MKKLILLAFALLLLESPLSAQEKNSLTFGLIADVQYAREDIPGKVRHYVKSLDYLKEAVDEFGKVDHLAFAVDLGDLTDRNFREYEDIIPVKQKLRTKWYNIYGNHDFFGCRTESDFAQNAAMKGLRKPYYSVERNGIRLIFLNCSDLATYSAQDGSAKSRIASQWLEDLKAMKDNSGQTWNGGIGLDQLAWLDKELSKADRKGQAAIICAHMLIYPFGTGETVWNGMELTRLIESHPSAKAVFCGHRHSGGYAERNGIHYVNFKGMVEGDSNHFAVITVSPSEKTIKIDGYGDEPDRVLKTR